MIYSETKQLYEILRIKPFNDHSQFAKHLIQKMLAQKSWEGIERQTPMQLAHRKNHEFNIKRLYFPTWQRFILPITLYPP